ncbi:MAG: alpha/beta hydrolase fold domain-containing protein [Pseudomonadota bacterium]
MTATFPWDGQTRHWRDRALAWGAKTMVRPMLRREASWASHRRGFRTAAALRLPARARGVTWRPLALGPGGALEVRPEAPERRLLYIHGGGFVLGTPRTHLVLLTHLARAANAAILAPAYRLAPEHPFPAAPEDVEAAADAALGWRSDLGPLFLGGDSAGGCLALVALLHLLRRGAGPLGGTVLFSPATIVDPARPVPEADDLLFPEILLHRIGAAYAGAADPSDPRLAPVHGDYTGAPPTLIHCVAGEFLEEDSDTLAARLHAQGVPVTLEKVRAMPHAWHFMAGSSPLADDAVARAGTFIGALA